MIIQYDVYVPKKITEKNSLDVKLTIKNHKQRVIRLNKSGIFIEIPDIRLLNGRVYVEESDDLSYIRVAPSDFMDCQVLYTAHFGQYDIKREGKTVHGRHGRQGYLGEDFGLFKGGNIFLMPELKHIKDVKVKFHFKNSWKAVTLWENDKKFFKRLISKKALEKNLMEASIGLGDFYDYKKEFTDSTFKVYISTAGFKEKDAFFIYSKLLKIFELQKSVATSSSLDYYTAIVVPDLDTKRSNPYVTNSDNKIFGGMSSYGQGLSFRKYYKRDYELFAHRLQHAISIYKPTGMQPKSGEDSWYGEGLAGYFELVSLYNTALVHDMSRLRNHYYNTYIYLTMTDPEYSLPVARADEAEEKLLDFLHYVKAPILVFYLEEFLERSTKGKNTLMSFLRYQLKKHSSYSFPYSLAKDLSFWQYSDVFMDDYVRASKFINLADIFRESRFRHYIWDIYALNILARVNGYSITEADIREYDVCLPEMIENDIGRELLEKRFSDLPGFEKHGSAWKFNFFRRYGDLPVSMYVDCGFVDIMIILKLLDIEAEKAGITSKYDGILDSFQGFRAAKRLKLRLKVLGLESKRESLSKMRASEYEKKWQQYIEKLLSDADIRYY